MKRILLAIILILPLIAPAQKYVPFPTKNCIWTEYYRLNNGTETFHNFALKNSDTIINGISYHKLYHSYDTIFTEDKLCGGLREENKRVYFYPTDSVTCLNTPIPINKEIILYDFNLQLGDTITEDTYRIRYLDILDVERIDSVQLNGGEYRKRYTFGLSDFIMVTEQWIEGIGCFRGILSDIGDIPTNNWNCLLICCIQDGEVLFHEQFPNCYNTNPNAVQSLKNGSRIEIAPNPASSSVRIKLDKPDYQRLILSDLTGRPLRQYRIDGLKTLTVEREGLPNGTYLLSVYDQEGNMQTLKMFFNQ